MLVSSGQRRTGPPTEPGFSQGFFLHFCHWWSFGSLPLSPLVCLVGDTSFLAKLSAWLQSHYLNWAGRWSLNQQWTDFNWKIDCLLLSSCIIDTLDLACFFFIGYVLSQLARTPTGAHSKFKKSMTPLSVAVMCRPEGKNLVFCLKNLSKKPPTPGCK